MIKIINPVYAQNTFIGSTSAGPGFAISLGSIITTMLSFVMAIAALAVFLYLIWGGFEWITSGGDKNKAEQARTKITTAVIGLFVLASSYALLRLILNILGFDSLTEALNGIRRIR
ncbi:MAG TPA: hypothetical protein PKX78_01100 [Candidatus Woesebacteria bacterium]|nr:hypothetical protein [Candidatus Woesebacteria bacterium]